MKNVQGSPKVIQYLRIIIKSYEKTSMRLDFCQFILQNEHKNCIIFCITV